MNIPKLQKEIHEYAKEKGWWDNERSAGEIYALIHSEISEAVECARNGEPPVWYRKNYDHLMRDPFKKTGFPADGEKPEGELIELADVVIRILDYAESRNKDYMTGGGLRIYPHATREKEHVDRIGSHLEFYNLLHGYIVNSHRDINKSESTELSYCLTLICYFCKSKEWDLWKAVRCKMEYNKTRSYRHGGKKY